MGKVRMAPITRAGECGFTYIAALFLISILGMTSLRAVQVWKTRDQRNREAELLEVGEHYRAAIRAYYEHSPGTAKHYPVQMDDLLLDTRSTVTVRHLRRLLRDPITNTMTWGVIYAEDGGIAGVYSLSATKPMHQAGFFDSEAGFNAAQHYYDWKFLYVPPKN